MIDQSKLPFQFEIPFYVAAPTSTFDLECMNGNKILIEERNEKEVLYQDGTINEDLETRHEVLVSAPKSKAYSPAFDVTPAKYITGIITEKGIINPAENEIRKLLL